VESEPKDLIVLGAIKNRIAKFEKIQKTTQIEPEELNSILEKLEERGFITIGRKKDGLEQKLRLLQLIKVQTK